MIFIRFVVFVVFFVAWKWYGLDVFLMGVLFECVGIFGKKFVGLVNLVIYDVVALLDFIWVLFKLLNRRLRSFISNGLVLVICTLNDMFLLMLMVELLNEISMISIVRYLCG